MSYSHGQGPHAAGSGQQRLYHGGDEPPAGSQSRAKPTSASSAPGSRPGSPKTTLPGATPRRMLAHEQGYRLAAAACRRSRRTALDDFDGKNSSSSARWAGGPSVSERRGADREQSHRSAPPRLKPGGNGVDVKNALARLEAAMERLDLLRDLETSEEDDNERRPLSSTSVADLENLVGEVAGEADESLEPGTSRFSTEPKAAREYLKSSVSAAGGTCGAGTPSTRQPQPASEATPSAQRTAEQLNITPPTTASRRRPRRTQLPVPTLDDDDFDKFSDLTWQRDTFEDHVSDSTAPRTSFGRPSSRNLLDEFHAVAEADADGLQSRRRCHPSSRALDSGFNTGTPVAEHDNDEYRETSPQRTLRESMEEFGRLFDDYEAFLAAHDYRYFCDGSSAVHHQFTYPFRQGTYSSGASHGYGRQAERRSATPLGPLGMGPARFASSNREAVPSSSSHSPLYSRRREYSADRQRFHSHLSAETLSSSVGASVDEEPLLAIVTSSLLLNEKLRAMPADFAPHTLRTLRETSDEQVRILAKALRDVVRRRHGSRSSAGSSPSRCRHGPQWSTKSNADDYRPRPAREQSTLSPEYVDYDFVFPRHAPRSSTSSRPMCANLKRSSADHRSSDNGDFHLPPAQPLPTGRRMSRTWGPCVSVDGEFCPDCEEAMAYRNVEAAQGCSARCRARVRPDAKPRKNGLYFPEKAGCTHQ